MSDFVVSARKYRPQIFDDVVGQKAVTETLAQAVLAKKTAHAYLFCGSRGVGKTTCARILAKALNCSNLSKSGNPCGKCENCKLFSENRSLNVTELDAASNNSVENIRSLIENIAFQSGTGSHNVYIIDEVHMLSSAAFNAFLKTLEEPPKNVIFVLATTERQKIPATILSRCQVFSFKRISVRDIAEYLQLVCKKENVKAEKSAVEVIARFADGALRDGLSLLDQVITSTAGNLTFQETSQILGDINYDLFIEITQHIIAAQPQKAVSVFNKIVDDGFEVLKFTGKFNEHLRNLIVISDNQTNLVSFEGELREKIIAQSQTILPPVTFKLIDIMTYCEAGIKGSINQLLWVEIHLIKMCALFLPDSENERKKKSPVIEFSNPAPIQEVKQAPKKPQETEKPPQKLSQEKPQEAEVSPVEKKIEPLVEPEVVEEKSVNYSRSLIVPKVKEQEKKTFENPIETEKHQEGERLSESSLKKIWEDFLDSEMLVNKKDFKTFSVQLVDDDIEILIINEFQKKKIETDLQNFRQFLKNTESKPFFAEIRVKIDKSKAVFIDCSPRKKFENLVEANSELQELVEKLSLRLV